MKIGIKMTLYPEKIIPAAGLMVILTGLMIAASLEAQTPGEMKWSKVDVAGAPGAVQYLSGTTTDNLVFLSGSELWQYDSGSGQWAEMANYPNVGGQAVAAAGNHIWAGDAGGGNFHVFNGDTWSTIATGTTRHFEDAHAWIIEADMGYGSVGSPVNIFGRRGGRVYLSDGTQKTGQTGDTFTTSNINAVHGTADNTIWGAASAGNIGRSLQGGRIGTWESVNSPDAGVFYFSIYALDQNTAIVGSRSFGGYVNIWFTEDGGDSWTDTAFPLSENDARGIFATSLDNIWSVHEDAGAWHYDGNGWSQISEALEGGQGFTRSDDDLYTIHQLDGQIWIGGRDSQGNALLYLAVPEPSSLLLLGTVALLGLTRRRR